MDIQASVKRHERSIKALEMLQRIERITPQSETEMVLQQFILKCGTEGAAAELNRMGLRLPGKTARGPRKYISTDITAVVEDPASYTGVNQMLAYVSKGLNALKNHRKN